MKFKHYILMNEASYDGNIGFEELAKFWKISTPTQKKKMNEVLEKEDWNAFKELIRIVVGTKLK